jgi:outer membrane protein assembly factor BamB
MPRPGWLTLLLSLLFLTPCSAEIANGWRGNGTGLWPDANPPLVWSRTPKGVLAGLRVRADRPTDKTAAGSSPLENGLIRDWLVIGPFPVADSLLDFDKAQLAGETTVEPAAGDKVGSLVWKKMAAGFDDPWAFGPVPLPTADLAAAIGGYKRNQMAYAHAYLFAPKGGTVRAVVEHAHGLKAWLDGKEVYRSLNRGEGMGNYYTPARVEFGTYTPTAASRFDLKLKPGWNRLLVKVSTWNKDGWTDQGFCLRLMDLPAVEYESKNILWMTELPHRSNATPILVGKRLFVMAEPDELLCIDKDTGKILWKAANNYYETLTPAERKANPAFRTKVDPLLAELDKEKDLFKRLAMRTKLQKTLTEIDAERFTWNADGHFREHFGIVGFTTPTPVSDGKHVWVWCGNGIAACYDLDGKRQWITRVPARELTYASSPALADGVLGVYLLRLVGLDAKTGKVRWEQKRVSTNTGAILAARIAGVEVFVSQKGHIVRARAGKMLYRDRIENGSWGPPVILGNIVYLPVHGVSALHLLDFTGASGDEWKPKRQVIEMPAGYNLRNGKWLDRPTAGSPLIVDGLAYVVDIYGTFYALDLAAKKVLYKHQTELHGLFHYNALPVAASATLIGKHIVIQDNQGRALVLQPGRTFRQVGMNRIATQIDRWWPIPAQETIGYSPPIPDGKRIYLRGERYLYCIGEK